MEDVIKEVTEDYNAIADKGYKMYLHCYGVEALVVPDFKIFVADNAACNKAFGFKPNSDTNCRVCYVRT